MPAGWTNQTRGEGICPQGRPIGRGQRAYGVPFATASNSQRRVYILYNSVYRTFPGLGLVGQHRDGDVLVWEDAVVALH
eukprot:60853-Prorocentrum_minimum.AAC.1